MNVQNTPKKIALVTGANKGDLASRWRRQLAAADCMVLLGARNHALGERGGRETQG